jgi:hypothetical protein
MPEFFQQFRSCNVGSKTDTWCGSCPKCLFTFIILSPFLKPDTLVGIFGHNLLDHAALENIFDELTGATEIKPFECIGTIDEVNMALNESVLMYDKERLPFLLKKFQQQSILRHLSPDDNQHRMNVTETDHYVPGRYMNLLVKALR